MGNELSGSIADAATIANYQKWSQANLSWSAITVLPSTYNNRQVAIADASGSFPLYNDVWDSRGISNDGLYNVARVFLSIKTFTGLNITRADNNNTGNIAFGALGPKFKTDRGGYSSPGSAAAVSNNQYVRGGDIWLTTASDNAIDGANDLSYSGLFVAAHEIGHVLSLSHTANEPGENHPTVNANHNTQRYSIMSYNPIFASRSYLADYQLYDISALQTYYGRNTNYEASSTLYNIGSFVDSSFPTDSTNNRYYSIWDSGGGSDTIDLSAATSSADAVFVDLRPGHFSSIGHMTKIGLSNGVLPDAGIQNVSIAYGSLIENATGTPYSDAIAGNAFSNTLNGGAGNDVLYGSGEAVKAAEMVGTNIGAIAPDFGDYGYFDVGGYVAGSAPDESLQVDAIAGGDGNDFIWASKGADSVSGDAGDDIINGGYGADKVYGNPGNDLLYGNQNDDYIHGGQGNDAIYGGQDNDELHGGVGDDIAHGNLGIDKVYGEAGTDQLYGDDGNDYLEGGIDSGTGGQHDHDLLDGGGLATTAFCPKPTTPLGAERVTTRSLLERWQTCISLPATASMLSKWLPEQPQICTLIICHRRMYRSSRVGRRCTALSIEPTTTGMSPLSSSR